MTLDEIEEELEKLASPEATLQKNIADLYQFAEQQHATLDDPAEKWIYGQWCGAFHAMRCAESMPNQQHLMLMDHLCAIALLLDRLGLPRSYDYMTVATFMLNTTRRILELEELRESIEHPRH